MIDRQTKWLDRQTKWLRLDKSDLVIDIATQLLIKTLLYSFVLFCSLDIKDYYYWLIWSDTSEVINDSIKLLFLCSFHNHAFALRTSHQCLVTLINFFYGWHCWTWLPSLGRSVVFVSIFCLTFIFSYWFTFC